jgi:hypothetical protein
MAEKEQTKNKNLEELEAIKFDLIKKIGDLDNEFEVKFKQYRGDTQQRSADYTSLLNDSIKTSKDIGNLSRQINLSKKNTQYWSLKILQQQRECNDRDEQIMKEKLKILKHYHDLKRKMAT